MAMSNDEFNANLRVQQLKPQVDEAERRINANNLGTLGDKELATLSADVGESIKKRTYLQSLGSHGGHLTRIGIESGFLQALNQEVVTRKQVAANAARANANAQMQSMPNVLANSSWGKPK